MSLFGQLEYLLLPALALVVLVAVTGQTNGRSGAAAPVRADELSRLRSSYQRLWGEELVLKFESLPVEQAVDRVMQAVGGSGTDYGQMLLDLDEQLMHRIDHRTTVLVLGDARNNRANALREAKRYEIGRAHV